MRSWCVVALCALMPAATAAQSPGGPQSLNAALGDCVTTAAVLKAPQDGGSKGSLMVFCIGRPAEALFRFLEPVVETVRDDGEKTQTRMFGPADAPRAASCQRREVPEALYACRITIATGAAISEAFTR
ncbi:MAG: hypothetical protein IPK81_25300 [Rhodospirillales bacterium]|nr:MAG: hypothetical protein IPK81_25300 [Rhodospirillales bacterium]